jgi:hypothetical protein
LKRLVILSDIKGLFLPEHPVMTTSSQPFKQFDAADKLNSLVLAGIEENENPEGRHQAFITGGIDVAAEKLVTLYPAGVEFALGLSVGGAILWRAALKGLSIGNLLCFSSTRLRFETNAPTCGIRLYFGENDSYRPDAKWFQDLGLQLNLVPGAGHEFYRATTGVDIFHHELEKYS